MTTELMKSWFTSRRICTKTPLYYIRHTLMDILWRQISYRIYIVCPWTDGEWRVWPVGAIMAFGGGSRRKSGNHFPCKKL